LAQRTLLPLGPSLFSLSLSEGRGVKGRRDDHDRQPGVSLTHRGTLFRLTGKVNNVALSGLDADECLFLGTWASKRRDEKGNSSALEI